MARKTLFLTLSLVMAFCAQHAFAQREVYVATNPGEGEAPPIYLMLQLDATGSHMVDTLWFLDPTFGAGGPLIPPGKPAKVWALFRGKDVQWVQVPIQRISKDSVCFSSARFTDKLGWMTYDFAGRRKGRTIQGTLVQKVYLDYTHKIDTETCRLSFQKVGVVK